MTDEVKIPSPIAATAKTLAKVAKVKKPAVKKPLPKAKQVVAKKAAKAAPAALPKKGQKVEFPHQGKKMKGVVFRIEKPIPTGQFIRIEYENALHEKQYASKRPSQVKPIR